jgi:hypothetical protein
MPYFKDADECNEILGGFFRQVSDDVSNGDKYAVEIQTKMSGIGLITSFILRDPEITFTLDFTKNPFTVSVNNDSIVPTTTFSLTGDTGHKFWHGKVNLAKALTTKTIVARGPIPKILKLLPVIKPLYQKYPAYLRERGQADLVLSE